MKCFINGVEVEAKVTENMGFQGGHYVKAIEYKGKEYIVQKQGKTWWTRTVEERVKPLRDFLIKKSI
jgi:hypothetical protein